MNVNPELDSLLRNDEAEKKIPTATITLDLNEINAVLAALQELPHRVADPILRKIMQQARTQIPN